MIRVRTMAMSIRSHPGKNFIISKRAATRSSRFKTRETSLGSKSQWEVQGKEILCRREVLNKLLKTHQGNLWNLANPLSSKTKLKHSPVSSKSQTRSKDVTTAWRIRTRTWRISWKQLLASPRLWLWWVRALVSQISSSRNKHLRQAPISWHSMALFQV